MLTRNRLQRGEGKLESFDPEVGRLARRKEMVDEEAWMEQEWNYDNIFFTMEEKVDKLFAKYENKINLEKKELDDHASKNHQGGGKEPIEPPSPSSTKIYFFILFSSFYR